MRCLRNNDDTAGYAHWSARLSSNLRSWKGVLQDLKTAGFNSIVEGSVALPINDCDVPERYALLGKKMKIFLPKYFRQLRIRFGVVEDEALYIMGMPHIRNYCINL